MFKSSRTETILLDDTTYFIGIKNGEEFKCIHSYEYNNALRIILSGKQFVKYTKDDTAREFKTTEFRLEKFIGYMKNNYWRTRGLTEGLN